MSQIRIMEEELGLAPMDLGAVDPSDYKEWLEEECMESLIYNDYNEKA